MKNFLIDELTAVDMHCKDSIDEYVSFCLKHHTEYNKGETADHHILPRALFPEYSDFRGNDWNKATLSNDNHYIAHSLLHNAIENISIASAWYAMNNKNYFNGEPIKLLGHRTYRELISKRNKIVSTHNKDMVMCKHISNLDGKSFKVTKSEFDNNTDLVGHTYGFGGDHLKNTVTVILSCGKISRVNKNKMPKGSKHIRSGKACVKDKNGNLFVVSATDERYLSGELVGFNKGLKFDGSKLSASIAKRGGYRGNKNSRAQRIVIYNNDDIPMFCSHGNFVDICVFNKLPTQRLANTYKNNTKMYIDDVDESKYIAERSKELFERHKTNFKFIGWYARIVSEEEYNQIYEKLKIKTEKVNEYENDSRN